MHMSSAGQQTPVTLVLLGAVVPVAVAIVVAHAHVRACARAHAAAFTIVCIDCSVTMEGMLGGIWS